MQNLTVEQIFAKHTFSHKFYVKYAVLCAKYAMARTKSKNPQALHAIDLADRFSRGEVVSKEDLEAAASSAASYAASAASNAAYAAYAASSAASAASNAAYAAYAAAATTTSKREIHAILLDLIQKEHCKVELALLGFEV